MTFVLSSTFTDSLAKLTTDEQKLVKTTAFDLQVNPANPGHQFHKLDAARDKNFWSVRVSSDIRIIIHRSNESLMLCHVDHHDDAYAWAARRKVETHPNTGAAQIVEIRETVKEVLVPHYVDEPVAVKKPLLFSHYSDSDILSWGVPGEWLDDVRAADEDCVLDLAEHLPAEAAEAILEVATGNVPRKPEPLPANESPFLHPDAQRRFRILETPEELEQAFEYPWDKWITFLHPDQRTLVEKDYNGPCKISGSAGTGKTIVALHRAVHLARKDEDARVLLVTFSDILAHALKNRLDRLIAATPRLSERIEVHSMESLAIRLFKAYHLDFELIGTEHLDAILFSCYKKSGLKEFTFSFVQSEWHDVVDAWNMETWESYRDILRSGRKIRLTEEKRKQLWALFASVRETLVQRNQITISGMYYILAEKMTANKHPPYEYVIVDEAQDISISQLTFLAAFGADVPNRLTFCGDTGQRIFRHPFSWSSIGIEVRGRSTTLSVNYRTSHQIRMKADKLLDKEIQDADGNSEIRTGTVSLFNGPEPSISINVSVEKEKKAVIKWIRNRIEEGLALHEIAICVRSFNQIGRAHSVLEELGIPWLLLDEHVETVQGKLVLCTMHLAKGLEFRAVAVMACDDGILPDEKRLAEISEAADLEEVYASERQLLYVACTRARDFLLITSGGDPSDFLLDLK